MSERDTKAIDILFRTFWSSEGWKAVPRTPPEEFEYAKSRGVMFDEAVSMTHDELVLDVISLARSLKPPAISDAFLVSLRSRQLELRSALGSYAVARLLPEHEFVLWEGSHGLCAICGLNRRSAETDWNVLNFERFKWGGVRHDDLVYVKFDLEQFMKADACDAAGEDVALFRQAISDLEALPPETTAPKAESALRSIPSNKTEREVILDILGLCGVLETSAHRGYAQAFVPMQERELPPLRYTERTYPVVWWKASDGVNREALATFALPA